LISIANLKKVAAVETVSWTLLIIATLADRISGWHGGVSIMGPIHGILFLALVAVAIGLTITLKWHWAHFVKIMLSSFVPIYGYFLIDHEAESVGT
jgi:integral membrane protein